MRAAFDTDSPTVCAMDDSHHLPEGGFILPVLPEKRQDVILFLIRQQGLNGFVHDDFLSILCFCFLYILSRFLSIFCILAKKQRTVYSFLPKLNDQEKTA